MRIDLIMIAVGQLQRHCIQNIAKRSHSHRSFSSASGSVSKFETAFNDANAAKFIAATTTAESIPKLQGLPEVIVAGKHLRRHIYGII